MTAKSNPFEYLGANDLPEDMILDYYIEDFNYSRLIQTRRNILLVGDRGSGKSMTLLYNSWPLQRRKAEREQVPATVDLIGIYVPCNTPLTHKREYQLLPDLAASAISEHYLVLSLVYHVAKTLSAIPDVTAGADEDALRAKIEYIFDAELPKAVSFFDAIMLFVERENIKTQKTINDRRSPDVWYDATFTFSSMVVPVLNCIRQLPALSGSHFMFLIDDAHDLNTSQIRFLNSWMAFRDHSVFSFKVAIASVLKSSLKTASGGSILEGHDFTRLDMIQPYHNETSNFGRLAHRLIEKRLTRFGINVSPEEFFPSSPQLIADLQDAEEAVRREAEAKYGNDSRKVSDYVYKYKRAYYFRSRSPRANRPEYSGFDTLVFISTGVIRNLLYPCYWMYDKVVSLAGESFQGVSSVARIPAAVQTELVMERSRQLWDTVRNELDQTIEGCSREDAVKCYRLLDNLAILFRERLLHHKSEPRAVSFTVSGQSETVMPELLRLFEILREAQLLYVRSGSAKDKGKIETYYVPNRMLWPERGLDPHGQHARVSLSAKDLMAAALNNQPLQYRQDEEDTALFELFDEN
jgi:hypothetical protein